MDVTTNTIERREAACCACCPADCPCCANGCCCSGGQCDCACCKK